MKKIIILLLTAVYFTSCSINSTKKSSLSNDTIVINKNRSDKDNLPLLKDSTQENLWITRYEDKVTGNKYFLSVDPIILANLDTSLAIRITFAKSVPGKAFWVTFYVYGGGSCIDKGDEIDILFRDSTRTKIYNHFKFNCDQESIEYFRGAWDNNNALKMLETKPIAIVRVNTDKDAIELPFTNKDSYDFIHTINWMDRAK